VILFSFFCSLPTIHYALSFHTFSHISTAASVPSLFAQLPRTPATLVRLRPTHGMSIPELINSMDKRRSPLPPFPRVSPAISLEPARFAADPALCVSRFSALLFHSLANKRKPCFHILTRPSKKSVPTTLFPIKHFRALFENTGPCILCLPLLQRCRGYTPLDPMILLLVLLGGLQDLCVKKSPAFHPALSRLSAGVPNTSPL
jgi:hypothetical protein